MSLLGWLATLALGSVLGVVALGAWAFLPALWAMPPLHRGDYVRAARRAALCRGCYGGALFEAAVLIYADRLAEAESRLRELTSTGPNGRATLAAALLAAGRYDEARRVLDHVMIDDPESDVYRLTLAQVQLRSGRITQALLGHVEAALAAIPDEWPISWIDPNLRAECLATRAWAKAELGDREGALDDVGRALGSMARSIPYALAEVHWSVGHAYRALGEAPESRHHFEMAAACDPRGLFGRYGREALAEASAVP